MSRRAAVTNQADVARALRAVRAAGMQSDMQVEVRADGTIVICPLDARPRPSGAPAVDLGRDIVL